MFDSDTKANNLFLHLTKIYLKFIYSPAVQESNFALMVINDEIVRKLESQAAHSISFLNAVLQLDNVNPKVLSFDTFQMLTENSTEIKQDWNNVHSITIDEFRCQVKKNYK